MKKQLLFTLTILISGLLSAQNQASFSTNSNWQNLCTNGDSILFTADYDTTGIFTGKGITDFGNGTASYSAAKAGTGIDTVIYSIFDTARIDKVSLGYAFSCFIKDNGKLLACGSNYFGQLGNGTTKNSNTPTQVGIDSTWAIISSGGAYNLSIKKNGSLWAWGGNNSGQLGDGTTTDRHTPVQIGNDSNWKFVSTGSAFHSIGLKLDGTLWGWGDNDNGQLGDGTTINRHSPVLIGQDTTWKMVATGYDYSIGLKSNGTLWAWGYNRYGQLGIGSRVYQNSPIQIGQDTTWVMVSAESDHSLAIKSDGTLWTWGKNNFGQLGDGTTTDRLTAIQIGTDSTWKTLSTGGGYSMAIKMNGSLWAWGYNAYGELGSGTTTNQTIPIQIGTDTNWSTIELGSDHSSAFKKDGSLWIWGPNNSGQLGNGTNTNNLSPNQFTSLDTNATFKVITIAAPTASSISQHSCISYLWAQNNTTYTISGTYKDSILNAAGCDSVISLHLTIKYIDTSVTQILDSLYANENSATYQWIDCENGNIAISGANNKGFKPPKSGNYAVIVVNGNCSDTSSCHRVTKTGIREYNLSANSFVIYPNPTQEMLFLQLKQATIGKVLTVYDLAGKVVLFQKILNPKEKINVSSLSNGIYMLKYEGGVRKLIIAK